MATLKPPAYEAFAVSDGYGCGILRDLGPNVVAWVSKPGGFALGQFMAACVSLDDAQAIAAALNAQAIAGYGTTGTASLGEVKADAE